MSTYRGNLNSGERARLASLLNEGHSVRSASRESGIPYGRVRTWDKWRKEEVSRVSRRKPAGEATQPSFLPIKALVWDIECTNLRSDIGALMVVSFLDLSTGVIESKTIDDFHGKHSERELALVLWAKEMYEGADILIGHNSLAFDKNYMNGVLARHDQDALKPRFHIDTYQVARNGWKGVPQSYSLANLADLFRLDESKDKPSKHDWREANTGDPDAVSRLKERCEADVRVTALLWHRIRPYWQTWKGR